MSRYPILSSPVISLGDPTTRADIGDNEPMLAHVHRELTAEDAATRAASAHLAEIITRLSTGLAVCS